MKRLMMTASVVAALGLGISSTALAGGNGNKTSSNARNGQVQLRANVNLNKKIGQGQTGSPQFQTLNNQFSNGGKNLKIQNDKHDKYDKQDKYDKHDLMMSKGSKGQKEKHEFKLKKYCDFKDYSGHCYVGKTFRFWNSCYFDVNYGCDVYYCPVRTCWYFWFEPWDCYLPCDYWVNCYQY